MVISKTLTRMGAIPFTTMGTTTLWTMRTLAIMQTMVRIGASLMSSLEIALSRMGAVALATIGAIPF